jgi:hypothetical protein
VFSRRCRLLRIFLLITDGSVGKIGEINVYFLPSKNKVLYTGCYTLLECDAMKTGHTASESALRRRCYENLKSNVFYVIILIYKDIFYFQSLMKVKGKVR